MNANRDALLAGFEESVPLPGSPAYERAHPETEAAPPLISHLSLISQSGSPHPELDPAALHGIIGEIVTAIRPTTEAADEAVFAHLLVFAGNAIGHGPYFATEDDRQRTNLDVVIVGETADGRKGTALGRAKRVMELADPQWCADCIEFGLASGEGLIWRVRDQITRMDKGELVLVDPGIADKRVTFIETEFGSVLKIAQREGSILSNVLRQAWERGDLRTTTKTSPAKATDAQISVIGHITATELLRHLLDTEAANGFGNRMVWVLTRRARILPDGAALADGELFPLARRLGDAIAAARQRGRMVRDTEARELWHKVYKRLTTSRPGLLGSLVARGAPQVMRVALIFALLDQSVDISREHLEAALAFWRYSEASAASIFGDRLGDPVADAIRVALLDSPEGMTRSEISGLLGRHVQSARLVAALDLLASMGMAHSVRAETSGRPAEIWRPGCETSELSEKRSGLGDE